MCAARVGASDPISRIAAELGQQASAAAGLSFPIQNVCQCSNVRNSQLFQLFGIFALH